MDPSPSLLGSSINDLECFGRKHKLKIDCDFNFFSIFLLPPKTEKLRHVIDCNIVGVAKLLLSFIFPFPAGRIKVKIQVSFQYSTKKEKIQIFLIWHFRIFYDKK